ncbi:unnamed protein product [Lactuca virosa]|uniref:Pentatricopeptide repeat-containing protein n=1 Tax=Lactuca virosa TaxID=75947 RepID=A0AAU9PN59_9ASTR|nr:unnamed protein product [Lactuca virosa]
MFLVFHRDQVIFESSLSSNSNRPPMASADQQRSAKVVAGVSTSTPLNPIKARLKSFVSPWKNRTLRVIQNLSTPLSNGYQSLIWSALKVFDEMPNRNMAVSDCIHG